MVDSWGKWASAIRVLVSWPKVPNCIHPTTQYCKMSVRIITQMAMPRLQQAIGAPVFINEATFE
jgi:hypothetical protein